MCFEETLLRGIHDNASSTVVGFSYFKLYHLFQAHLIDLPGGTLEGFISREIISVYISPSVVFIVIIANIQCEINITNTSITVLEAPVCKTFPKIHSALRNWWSL